MFCFRKMTFLGFFFIKKFYWKSNKFICDSFRIFECFWMFLNVSLLFFHMFTFWYKNKKQHVKNKKTTCKNIIQIWHVQKKPKEPQQPQKPQKPQEPLNRIWNEMWCRGSYNGAIPSHGRFDRVRMRVSWRCVQAVSRVITVESMRRHREEHCVISPVYPVTLGCASSVSTKGWPYKLKMCVYRPVSRVITVESMQRHRKRWKFMINCVGWKETKREKSTML